MTRSSQGLEQKVLEYGSKVPISNRYVRESVRTGKTVLNARKTIEYKRQYKQLVERNRTSLSVPQHKGYCSIGRYEIPEVEAAVNQANDLFKTYSSEIDDPEPGLQNIMPADELSEYDEIVDLASSDTVLGIAADYLQTMPKLVSVHLWWTPPNDNEQGSQLFHLDSLDSKQIKFLFNVSPVTEDSGPFACIPSDRTDEFKAAYGKSYLTTQEVEYKRVFEVCDEDDVIKSTGAMGSGMAVDTSRCLHYGSRRADKKRVILRLQFAKPFAPKREESEYDLSNEDVEIDDPLKREVLS